MGKSPNKKAGSAVHKIASIRHELAERFTVQWIGVFGSFA
jgi:hypothetical protein